MIVVSCTHEARIDEVEPASPTDEPTSGVQEPADELEWRGCGAVECATLAVAVDPEAPDGATIDLALARHSASGERRGSILMNPGGPGASGLFLAEVADELFEPEVLEHFDVVAWDPRGVGSSTAVDCLDDLDGFWSADRSPDDAAEVDALEKVSQELATGCEQRSGELLEHVSSDDTVADMDAIRAALGDEALNYVGYSYGTYLGSLYAEAYPDRVRAMVLDGAIDPSLTYAESVLQQSVGFDRALGSFFEWCTEGVSCAFGTSGDPELDFDELMRSIDAAPVPAGGSRALGPGEADIGVAAALYGGTPAWPTLARALELAATGDGSLLVELADTYTGRELDGSYNNEQEAFFATACVDAASPASVQEVAELAATVGDSAPRLGPTAVWLGLPCTFWPVAPQREPVPITASGAPPLLVLGTSGDPATPPQWAESLAAQLASGVLVTLDDEGHVASGRGNDCIDTIVADYLVRLAVPDEGISCAS